MSDLSSSSPSSLASFVEHRIRVPILPGDERIVIKDYVSPQILWIPNLVRDDKAWLARFHPPPRPTQALIAFAQKQVTVYEEPSGVDEEDELTEEERLYVERKVVEAARVKEKQRAVKKKKAAGESRNAFLSYASFSGCESSGAAPEGGDQGSGAATQLHRGESCGHFNDSEDEEPPQMTTSPLRRRDRSVLSIPGVLDDAPVREERVAATSKVAVSSEVDLETSEGQGTKEGTAGVQGNLGTPQKRRGDRHNGLAGSSKN
ncbi:hypothetical protein CBR_g30004 [Chara braunii]|uniref:Uncharacterized protein n=1 Tax=Chara braunii TaxID=69332 RepID=A0A388LBP3_CHABU|nr:hypothetical protein CBR_g30004 [Chara braunii]|eukprot:GBG79740.1 hypothetical protein CBR_g30004 [Chara braunii]